MESNPPSPAAIPIHCARPAVAAIHELRAHVANPNHHPERQFMLRSGAIRRHGWREGGIVLRRRGFGFNGNAAVEAARRIPTDRFLSNTKAKPPTNTIG
jgi:hypothetical protein